MDDLTKLKLLTDETDGAQGAGGGAGSPPCCPATATGEKAPCGACPSSEAEAATGRASARMFTDEQLEQLLALHDGDVYATAYDVLIRKAENSAVRLSGGTELPDQRDYWLSRARSVRPNATRAVGRADRT